MTQGGRRLGRAVSCRNRGRCRCRHVVLLVLVVSVEGLLPGGCVAGQCLLGILLGHQLTVSHELWGRGCAPQKVKVREGGVKGEKGTDQSGAHVKHREHNTAQLVSCEETTELTISLPLASTVAFCPASRANLVSDVSDGMSCCFVFVLFLCWQSSNRGVHTSKTESPAAY